MASMVSFQVLNSKREVSLVESLYDWYSEIRENGSYVKSDL